MKHYVICYFSYSPTVTLCGRDETRLQETLTQCVKVSQNKDDQFLCVTGDITDSAVRKNIVEKTVEKFGRLGKDSLKSGNILHYS